jgi:hypothetical protein
LYSGEKKKKEEPTISRQQEKILHLSTEGMDPFEDFLKAPVVPRHRPHSTTKKCFSQALTVGAPELLDDNNSSHS